MVSPLCSTDTVVLADTVVPPPCNSVTALHSQHSSFNLKKV